jgi:hypothetical protein
LSWDKSASSCRVVRAAVVFTRHKLHCLQLQVCLVSSSPSKVGQFRFEWCTLSQKISSGTYHLSCFGRLTCSPTPALSLWLACCSVPALSLCCYTCVCSLRVQHWKFSSLLHPCSPGRFSIPIPLLLWVLDYSSLFILFSFVGGVSVCPGAVRGSPGGWVVELQMLGDAHLFILQILASSFGAYQWVEIWVLFSVWCGMEAFHGNPRCHSLVLIDWQFDSVFCLLGEKKERETSGGLFFSRLDIPWWLCCMGLLWLLGGTKGWFNGQSSNEFYWHLMWWWLLFWLEAIRITQV